MKVNKAQSKVSHVKNSSVLGFKIHGKKLKTLDCKVKMYKRKLKRITRRCLGIEALLPWNIKKPESDQQGKYVLY